MCVSGGPYVTEVRNIGTTVASHRCGAAMGNGSSSTRRDKGRDSRPPLSTNGADVLTLDRQQQSLADAAGTPHNAANESGGADNGERDPADQASTQDAAPPLVSGDYGTCTAVCWQDHLHLSSRTMKPADLCLELSRVSAATPWSTCSRRVRLGRGVRPGLRANRARAASRHRADRDRARRPAPPRGGEQHAGRLGRLARRRPASQRARTRVCVRRTPRTHTPARCAQAPELTVACLAAPPRPPARLFRRAGTATARTTAVATYTTLGLAK